MIRLFFSVKLIFFHNSLSKILVLMMYLGVQNYKSLDLWHNGFFGSLRRGCAMKQQPRALTEVTKLRSLEAASSRPQQQL